MPGWVGVSAPPQREIRTVLGARDLGILSTLPQATRAPSYIDQIRNLPCRNIHRFSMTQDDIRQEPFPAPSKQAVGLVDGVETEVTRTDFSDKIMITFSQGGRLAQWVSAWV